MKELRDTIDKINRIDQVYEQLTQIDKNSDNLMPQEELMAIQKEMQGYKWAKKMPAFTNMIDKNQKRINAHILCSQCQSDNPESILKLLNSKDNFEIQEKNGEKVNLLDKYIDMYDKIDNVERRKNMNQLEQKLAEAKYTGKLFSQSSTTAQPSVLQTIKNKMGRY